MIKSVIIDDEKNAREFLDKLILRYFKNKILVLETCDSVKSGVAAIKKHSPELVFLDIQMPEENGFELFKYFNQISFEVIFTTAYKDYAIDAIRHSALDYLLKPINYIDLMSSIKRFEENREQKHYRERVTVLLENLSSETSSFNKIALPSLNGFDLVKLNSILYCESESNYCKVVCVDDKEYVLSKTLKYVEELINCPELFNRIHKSYLVNLNYITKYSKGDEFNITLVNGIELPVSVRKKEQFLNAILHRK